MVSSDSNADTYKNVYNSELEQTLIAYLLTNIKTIVSLLPLIIIKVNPTFEVLSKFY